MDKWDSLDSDAEVNLQTKDFNKFIEYKKKIKEDGHCWDGDAEDILTGFIWDALEEYNNEADA